MSKAEQLIDQLLDERVKLTLQNISAIAKTFGGTTKEETPFRIQVLFKLAKKAGDFAEFINRNFRRINFDIQDNIVSVWESVE